MQHDSAFSLPMISADVDLPQWASGLVQPVPDSMPTKPSTTSKPPPGCAPNAIKLFVGNIPKHYTEEQLLPLFESVGTVVELSITREKGSKASKGSAFLWYATPQAAEAAIQTFNMRHALPEVIGKEMRPLAVRPATNKPSPASRQHANKNQARFNPLPLQSPSTSQHPLRSLVPASQTLHPMLHPNDLFSFEQLEPSLIPIAPSTSFALAPPLAPQLQPLSNTSFKTATLAAPLPPHEALAAPSFSPAPPLLTSLASPSPAPEHSLVIHMSSRQLLAINSHLYSVHSMSGAHVSTVPLPEGMAALHVRGSQAQVGHAQQLVMLLCEYAN